MWRFVVAGGLLANHQVSPAASAITGYVGDLTPPAGTPVLVHLATTFPEVPTACGLPPLTNSEQLSISLQTCLGR